MAPREHLVFSKERRCFFVVENVVYLIRHGESVANTETKYQGQTYDTPLSPLGNKQANALAERLRSEHVARLITSPLTRTRETAEAVAKWHDGLRVEVAPEIIETNHGKWEGKNVVTIKENWPEEFETWQNTPSCTIFPNGDAFEDTRMRVLTWWKEFLTTVQGATIVIAHDNILRVLLVDALGMDPDSMWRFELQPAAITTIKVTNGKVNVGTINDTNHLEGLQANLANHAL